MNTLNIISRAIIILVTFRVFLLPLEAQVIVYPVVTTYQTFTYGTYREANQESITHYAARISYVDRWNSSWSGGYRRTGISYKTGFDYLQHQFVGSKGHSFVVGSNLLSVRGDLLYISSNSTLTDRNVTFYGGMAYYDVPTYLTLGLQAQGNVFQDVNTLGISGFVSGRIGEGRWITGRVNVDRFSTDIGYGRVLVSGNASYLQMLSTSMSLLLSGKFGRRSLYYEPDIFLLYNTFDAHTSGGGITLFVAPWRSVSLFADVSIDRFVPVGSQSYMVTYFSIGGQFIF